MSRHASTAVTADAVSSVDPWVVALAAQRRLENVAVFGQLEALAGMWADWAPEPLEELDDGERRRWHTSLRELHESLVITEAAGVLSMTEGAAGRRVEASVALLVTRRLPLTARLARRGRLEWRRIDALVTKTRCLTVEQCARVERQVLVPAVVGLTIGRFEDAVDRAVIAVDPDAAEERRTEVKRGRRVSLFKQRNGSEGTDGGATFWAEGPADSLASVMACLDASAKWWQAQGDTRTREQLRFDLFVTACTNGRLDVPHDLLTAAMTALAPEDGAPAAAAEAGTGLGPRPEQSQVPVHVNVTISLQTLLGLNDEPGALDRYGPIPAQMARDMAANGIWRCVVVDDVHGTVLGVGKTTYSHSYTPGTNLRTFLDVAAPECEIPWCHARAEFCDIEHHTPHAAGGATCSCNTGRTCRRHHRQKSAGETAVRPSEDPGHPLGTNIRTSPGGRQVVEFPYAPLPPEAYRITRPEPEPEEPVEAAPAADLPDDTPPF